jgi:hypothetical protein
LILIVHSPKNLKIVYVPGIGKKDILYRLLLWRPIMYLTSHSWTDHNLVSFYFNIVILLVCGCANLISI